MMSVIGEPLTMIISNLLLQSDNNNQVRDGLCSVPLGRTELPHRLQ